MFVPIGEERADMERERGFVLLAGVRWGPTP